MYPISSPKSAVPSLNRRPHFEGVSQQMKAIRLANETVTGDVTNVMEKIELTNVQVTGHVSNQMGKIVLNNQCRIGGNVDSGQRSVEIDGNTVVSGHVASQQGDIRLDTATVQQQVSSTYGRVMLSSATVNGDVSSGTRDVRIEEASRIKGNATSNSGNVLISASEIGGDVRSLSGRVTLENQAVVTQNASSQNELLKVSASKVLGNATTGSGKLVLEAQAEVGGNVQSASGRVKIDNSTVKGSLTTASGDILLCQAIVNGNVSSTSGDFNTLSGATIGGDLTLTQNDLTLEGVTVRNIRLNHQKEGGRYDNMVGLSISNISVGGSLSGGIINLGPGSSMDGQGLSIRTNATETRLLTDNDTLYVNGLRMSGDGPETYAEYRKANPSVPVIQGPGWPGSLSECQPEIKPVGEPPPEPEQTKQALTLATGSHVKGNIVFESGKGKLIIEPGARFDGTVEGGVVEGK